MIKCAHCGLEKEPDSRNPHLCTDCVRAENNRLSHTRSRNEGWMDAAAREGLELYERQPGETQLEWTIWQCYRDAYPGAKPSYKQAAVKAGTTYDFVRKTAVRWNFAVRMQAWMASCDRDTELQRRQEIINMNKDYIDMASKLRQKLHVAIDALEPEFMRPSDIVAMSKMASELERSARIDTLAQTQMQADMARDVENPELKKSPTKQNDLGEVVDILLKAGALGSITQIGVKETTTTTREVVATGGEPAALDAEVVDVD